MTDTKLSLKQRYQEHRNHVQNLCELLENRDAQLAESARKLLGAKNHVLTEASNYGTVILQGKDNIT
jgi:23S rRNA C2498 (ribose-2'-O)-methylase RlmM